jgi:hypothetical protein
MSAAPLHSVQPPSSEDGWLCANYSEQEWWVSVRGTARISTELGTHPISLDTTSYSSYSWNLLH